MKLIKNLLVSNNCYKAGKKIIPKGVMVHSTGANNPNLRRYCQPDIQGIGKNQYNNDWNRSGLNVCVHAFIGKLANGNIATVQTLPWNHRGWHCAKSGNDTHISFEICEDGLNDSAYFNKVYKEAVELTVYLCKMYKLDPLKDGVVICHKEGCQRGIASNHGDVMHWFPKHGKSMDDFRADVAAKLGVKAPKDNSFKSYLVKINTASLNVRAGAGTSYKVNTTVHKGEVYTIVAESNGWGKLKSGAGWIKLSYTKKL